MSATKRTAATSLHILILEPLLHCGDGAGPTRTFAVCRELAQYGHRVTVLTSSSGSISNSIDAEFSILSFGNNPLHQFGYPAPAPIYRSFALGTLWRIWRVTKVDAVLTPDRPHMILPIAALFCKLRGIPLVVDGRGGIPKTLSQAPLKHRLLTFIKRTIYLSLMRSAQRILVQNTNLRDALIINGIAIERTIETWPGCDTDLLHPKSKILKIPDEDLEHKIQEPIIIYAGRISAEDKLETVINIAAALQSKSENVTFLFYGDGPGRAKLESHASTAGVLNKSVLILDPVPRAKLPLVLTKATAVIGRIQDATIWDPSSHIFDALAAERPVIFAGANPHRELVVSRGAGIALTINDAQAAAREITDFINNAGDLMRARQQASALAAGRFNTHRVTADIRDGIEAATDEMPREVVLRQRLLWTKRALDILISLSALIILSPVLIGLMIATYTKMGRPVIFSQSRPGLKGNIFQIYKFRTMKNLTGSAGEALPDSERLTPLGRFMRNTSLDELPELFNVLRGDMSLVGPRPLLVEYLPYYSSEQRRRHDVLPGLTGWTQVNGRNTLTWEEKFTYDVWYVDNISLWLDLRILLKTVWVALRRTGVNAPGYSTMPRFDEIMARREGAEDD